MFSLLDHVGGLSHQSKRAGDTVFSRGDEGAGSICVVLEGEVTEMRQSRGDLVAVKTLMAGDFFGDIEAMADAPSRLRTYQVQSPTARVAFMEKSYAIKVGSLYPEFFLILLKNSVDELHAAEQELLKR